MSRVDFAARGLAAQSLAYLRAGLFADLGDTSVPEGIDHVTTTGHSAVGAGAGYYVCDVRADASLADAHPRATSSDAAGRLFRLSPGAGSVSFEQAGASGDGASDDRAAIQAAIDYGVTTGGRICSEGATYAAQPIPHSLVNYNIGGQPTLLLKPGVRQFDGRGATIGLAPGARGIGFGRWFAIDYPEGTSISIGDKDQIGDLYADVTSDLPAGTTTFPLEAGGGAKFAVGADAMYALGEAVYDTPETFHWAIGKVTMVDGDNVTLDVATTEDFDLSAVTNINRRLRQLPILRDTVISNLFIDGGLGAENGLTIYGGQRLTIQNVGARNVGAAGIALQYCENVRIVRCHVSGFQGGQLSYGNGFGGAELRDVKLESCWADGLRTFATAEAGASIIVDGGSFRTDWPVTNEVIAFKALGRAHIVVRDFTLSGPGGYRLDSISNGNDDFIGSVIYEGRLRMTHDAMPVQMPVERMRCILDVTINGENEIWDFQRVRKWAKRYYLRDDEIVEVFGPRGIVCEGRIYVSANATIGDAAQLRRLYVGRASLAGTEYANTGRLAAGKEVYISLPAGANDSNWQKRDEQVRVVVNTSQRTGLNSQRHYVEWEFDIAQKLDMKQGLYDYDYASRSGFVVGRDTYEAKFEGEDLPSIAAGATHVASLAIGDMAVGDMVEAVALSGGLQGLTIRSAEAKSGAVELTIENTTGSAIDPAAQTIRVLWSEA